MKSHTPLSRVALVLVALMGCRKETISAVAPPAAGSDATAPSGAAAPQSEPAAEPTQQLLSVTRLYPGESGVRFTGCTLGGPLWDATNDQIVIAGGDASVNALDPQTGALRWTAAPPSNPGDTFSLLASPALAGTRAVIAYQGAMGQYFAAVVDLTKKRMDPAYPPVPLQGSLPSNDGGMLAFDAATQTSHSALVYGKTKSNRDGFVYVSFGSRGDFQPWHGWMFELDLGRWKRKGAAAALSATLATTHASHCPVEGQPGDHDMICGGGIWAPGGPLVVPDASGSFDLLIPTGNGALDPTAGNFAHSLLRTRPGLAFDPQCDATACAGFDMRHPSTACLESCKNLYIPRLPPGADPYLGPSNLCAGKGLLECYASIDYDFGANSPVAVQVPGGPSALVMAAKDGSVSLIDGTNLGKLYDRLQIVEPCGAPGDPCTASYAGMIVTRPVVATLDGDPLVLVPTFMFDKSHVSGVVAVRVSMVSGQPHLEIAWRAPDGSAPGSLTRFRNHTGSPVVASIGGEDYLFVVDPGHDLGSQGKLIGVRVRDGEITNVIDLVGRGMRFAPLLFADGVLYVPSCQDLPHPQGFVEAYAIAPP